MDLASDAQVVLRPRHALPFYAGHPWVFRGAVAEIRGLPRLDPKAGPGGTPAACPPCPTVDLLSDRGEFIARGLYNPQSSISVRLYSWDRERPLDESFWSERLDAAIRFRRQLPNRQPDDGAERLVFSEADRLSGLIVDRYADWLLLQFTGRGLAERREMFVRLLQEKLQPAGIWLRTEKGTREAEGLELADGPLTGNEPPRPVFISEHGFRYGVDLVEGQKTGFFLDQRENRPAAARYFRGPKVLDLFCYSGGFSLHAARLEHVKSVRAIDISEPALKLARANVELNGLAHKVQFEKLDLFKSLDDLVGRGERYQTVICDPPKLARHRKSLPVALRAYRKLNTAAMRLLEPGGVLVTCSCTGHVSREAYEEMLAEAASAARRTLRLVEIRGQAPDHPCSVQCTENSYLKCYIGVVDDA